MKLLLTGLVLAVAANAQFDCRTREMWAPEKRVWCCANTGIGCIPAETVTMPTLNVLPETATTDVVEEFNCNTREEWLPDKKTWCCANKNLGCPPVAEVVETPATAEANVEEKEFDCRTREMWRPAKREWCCANKNLGCRETPRVAAANVEEEEFDCRTRELWLPKKKAWCCANKNLGCAPPAETVETPEAADATVEEVSERVLVEEFDCRTKELWLPKKKAWCCANKNLGCDDITKPGRIAPVSVGKARFLSMAERTSNSATLIWVPPEGTASCEAVVYTVKIREKGTKAFMVVRSDASDPIQTFENLTPDTAYEVRVVTGTGKATTSSRKIFRTRPER
jgi:hypothetical protein